MLVRGAQLDGGEADVLANLAACVGRSQVGGDVVGDDAQAIAQRRGLCGLAGGGLLAGVGGAAGQPYGRGRSGAGYEVAT